MVKKSGTNDFSGTAFYSTRDNSFVGTQAGPSKFNPGTFKYHNISGSIGGPIIRNKLFLFRNYENDGQTNPGTTFRASTGPADTGSNLTRELASDLESLSRFLNNSFHYITGPYQ